MNERDKILLLHMRDAALEVIEFTNDETSDSLVHNRLLLRGLSMSVGIIGEAASKVSAEFRDQHPEIPWVQIVSMRNRIIHGYYDIRLNRLWDTATISVPELLAQLEKLIPPD